MFLIKSDKNEFFLNEGSFRVINNTDIFKDDFLIFSFCSNKKVKIENGHIGIEESPRGIYTSQLQYICAEYIKNNSVLQIGADIDTCLLISKLTHNSVCLETNNDSYNKLKEYNLNTENCVLSKRLMVQKDDMILPCHIDVPGYKRVNIIDFETLQNKYFKFDTLIVNTKNALFYTLADFPNLLENISIIIIKIDFTELQKYNFVTKYLENFTKIDYETIPERYEVYKKSFL